MPAAPRSDQPALPSLRLNEPDGPERGFVLVLPGGGYRFCAEHEASPPLEWLRSIGWRGGVLDYSIGPASYPGSLTEVLSAIVAVRAGAYGPVDGLVGVLGFSAGGHLAGLAATATSRELAAVSGGYAGRPDFVLLGYPVVSMRRWPHLGARQALLGAESSDGVLDSLSVEERVDRAAPPMFLWTTADDEAVSARHTLLLADRLVQHGVPTELHVYPHGPHGLGLAADSPVGRWSVMAAEWIDALSVRRSG